MENPTDVPPKKTETESKIQKMSHPIRSQREFSKKYDIYVDTKLFLEANERKEKGQTDFAAFVLSRSNKHLPDLIENAWKIHNAKASIKCEKTTRMEILMKASLRAVLMVVR